MTSSLKCWHRTWSHNKNNFIFFIMKQQRKPTSTTNSMYNYYVYYYYTTTSNTKKKTSSTSTTTSLLRKQEKASLLIFLRHDEKNKENNFLLFLTLSLTFSAPSSTPTPNNYHLVKRPPEQRHFKHCYNWSQRSLTTILLFLITILTSREWQETV